MRYDDLLEEARAKANAFRVSAKQYVRNMYLALRNENPNITSEDARERIEKDLVGIWEKRTILDALPDETKDPKKQTAARSRQIKPKSVAVSAAPIKKKEEIIIGNEGNAIGIGTPPLPLNTPSDDCFTPSENNNWRRGN
jgi:hypothetical protein